MGRNDLVPLLFPDTVKRKTSVIQQRLHREITVKHMGSSDVFPTQSWSKFIHVTDLDKNVHIEMQTLNQTVNLNCWYLPGWIRVLVVMVCVFVCQLYAFHISAQASVFVWTFMTWRRGILCLWRLLIILFPRISVCCCFLSTHSSPSVKCLCFSLLSYFLCYVSPL